MAGDATPGQAATPVELVARFLLDETTEWYWDTAPARKRDHYLGEAARVIDASGLAAECERYRRERDEAREQLATTQAHRERLNRELATLTRELNAKDRERGEARKEAASLRAALGRIATRVDSQLLAEVMASRQVIITAESQALLDMLREARAALEAPGGR